MKKMNIAAIIISVSMISACSVQQFPVNTTVQPFQNGGRVWGERTERCGEKAMKLETKKSGDFFLLGINLTKTDAKKMADDLNATSYTIESKSNIIFMIITAGVLDYRIVKVIKREN